MSAIRTRRYSSLCSRLKSLDRNQIRYDGQGRTNSNISMLSVQIVMALLLTCDCYRGPMMAQKARMLNIYWDSDDDMKYVR